MNRHEISREELNDFLVDGDAVLNCGGEALASVVPAVSLNSDGTARLIRGPAYPLNGDASLAIESLKNESVDRFVVVSDGDGGQQYVDALKAADLPYVICVIDQTCDSSAFMDEEDSEAVAERLRQLGYI